MLRVGMFLSDRYEILEKIGSGGMSDVYKAKCHKLNRHVAIKVLKSEFSSDINFVTKFKIEAQSAAGLSHNNIVNIYDVGDEGGTHFIVMELIEGITLKDYINRKGKLETRECVGIGIQVAQGIEAAHEQNIVHRDIKPQNIIISRDGKVKVTDFGIARAASTETINSNAIGSVHYISPEQARGGYSDVRSDIYSFGITLYEMITGRVPYEGDSAVAVAVLHLTEPLIPPREYVPDIPVSLEKIILKCTEKKPERRYSTAGEMIVDLKRALVMPDEDFVKIAPLEDTSPTLVLSKDDVSQIKRESKLIPSVEAIEQAASGVDLQGMNQDNEGKRKISGKGLSIDEEEDDFDDDVNPKIERILNFAGIGVAIVIVIVIIVILVNVLNLFPSKPDTDPTDPTIEDSQTLAADETYVPDLYNVHIDEAIQLISDSGLGRKVEYAKSNTIPEDYIMEQSEEAGDIIKKHSTITITVSTGPDYIEIANLGINGKSYEEAEALLTEKGLKVSKEEEFSTEVEVGKVIRYEPSAKVVEGDSITLYVSLGKEIKTTKIPNLLGLTEQAAVTALQDADLVAGTITREYDKNVAEGKVMSQAINASQEVDSDTAVDFVVSLGPSPEKEYKYYGAISVTFDCASYFGPGGGSEIQLLIRLHQVVDGEDRYTTIIPVQTVDSNSKIPIQYSRLEGADGVTSGIVEVYQVDTEEVLRTYPVIFTKTEVD